MRGRRGARRARVGLFTISDSSYSGTSVRVRIQTPLTAFQQKPGYHLQPQAGVCR
jgi:hypothetical protein